MKKLRICGALLCVLWAGCTVGPNYQRPKVSVPTVYRGEAPSSPPQPSTASLGNEKWWTVFNDPVLQQLIRTALKQNYDIQIAATRVLQAQAQLGITRSNQYPTLSAGADILSTYTPKISSVFPAYKEDYGQLDLSLIWNLDFWGKYRRETEAARANLLASEWGRRAVITSVVSSVATAYFELRELDLALEISRRTLASRQDSLRLTQVLADNGSASLLDLREAQELVDTAAETIPDLERQIQQQEDLISDLLGENPGPVARGLTLTEEPAPLAVPAGLPSELLERRAGYSRGRGELDRRQRRHWRRQSGFFPQHCADGYRRF